MTRATVRYRNRSTERGQAPLSPRLKRLLDRIPTFVLFLIAGLWTLPTAGLAVSSLRNWPRQQSGWWTDLFSIQTWTLDGYRSAVSVSVNNSFAEGMFNSFAIAVPATLLPLLFASLAAYAIGWIPFRRKTAVFFGLVALIALPVQAVLISLLQTYSGGAHLTLPVLQKTVTLFPDLSLGGTLPAVWLTLVGFALPFSIFLLTVSMTRIPRSLVDAARADGASHMQIFWRIAIPLVTPTLAGLGVLLFLWGWNEYLIALTMIGGNNPTAFPATVRLVAYGSATGGPTVAAAAFLHSAVAIGVFLSLQRYFARALVVSVE